MGVDETYPLHRYFARVKDVARLLGGVEADARRACRLARRPRRKNIELTATQRAFKDEVRELLRRAGVAPTTGSR